MEVDRKSWHYRLAETYSSLHENDMKLGNYNFCQYSRKVMSGFLLTLLVTVIGVFVGLGWIQGIGSLIIGLFTDQPWQMFMYTASMEDAGGPSGLLGILSACSLILQGILAFIFLCAVGGDSYSEWKRDRRYAQSFSEDGTRKKKEPGFFATWYRSWKDKYCPVVTLKQLPCSERPLTCDGDEEEIEWERE